MTNQSTYILSLEASDIYSHMNRNNEIKLNYCGMIPYSLELIKLKQQKEFITFTVKHSEREFSNDMINVKFNQKVKSGKELIEIFNKKVKELEKEINTSKENVEKITEYKQKIEDYIQFIEKEKEKDNNQWKGLSKDTLREHLYLNGFTITNENGKQTKYRVYKRSSSKSRQGQCLFIKESLYEEMINWSRMYLPFKDNMKVDLAGLLAYESLVGSSLESTIKIKPINILIVDDVESEFIKLANVIRKGKDDYLESATEEAKFSNSLFDGESLLEAKYFENGVSMKLLRNHFFKSAAFSCNIQQFLQDHCPKDIPFDEWKIPNMFNEKMLAKNIELIITPSSLKVLKFASVLDEKGELTPIYQKKKMFHYWKKIIHNDKSNFGVCKHEKKSKHGTDENGNVLQQLSYQMINSIPMNKKDMETLTQWERVYIKRLKDDDKFFIEYLREKANDMNCFEMFADVYDVNKNIANNELFRLFRSREISNYANRVKGGKVRLVADYAILLGNPLEFLFHSIGRLNKDLTIKDENINVLNGNQVFTKLFPMEEEYIGFRNPHTFAGNVLIMKNTYNQAIDTYFNLSNNVVAVNAINFEIPSILSGADYDSDSMLIVNNRYLLGLCKKFIHTENGQYKNDFNVCLKDINSDMNNYLLNNTDMAKIDNKLSLSQKFIGSVVNNGQFTLSAYWNQLRKGKNKNELKELLGKIYISAILSEISIDLAKKSFDLNIKKEMDYIEKFSKQYSEVIDNKFKFPIFWKYVKDKKNQVKVKDNKLSFYYCPMDLLQSVMKVEYAKDHENVEFIDLLKEGDFKKANYKQEQKVWDYVEKLDNRIKNIYADGELDEEEQMIKLDNAIKLFSYSMDKLTVKKDTMYALLVHMSKNKEKPAIKLMKILHETQKNIFLESFKNE